MTIVRCSDLNMDMESWGRRHGKLGKETWKIGGEIDLVGEEDIES